MGRPGTPDELLRLEETDAWFEYLEATRELEGRRYEEGEPWAWARLTQRLDGVRERHLRHPKPVAA
jgi:hypothetical protein